jgi:GTP-binding protein
VPTRRPPRRPHGGRDRTGHKGPRRPRRERHDALARDPTLAPPVVAIVGRPNVGKSTLSNALAKSRVSIVEPTPGVTRDRVGVLATLADRTVELMDTGGIGLEDAQGLAALVERQADEAIRLASVVLFVVDAREGVTPLDVRVAQRLRKASVPVLLLANKAETGRVAWNLGEMPSLGFGEPLPVSAQGGLGLDRLEEEVERLLPTGPTTPRRLPAAATTLAVVGRVNAGKSSLVNALVREERMIVSEVPGTTRDSVDVRLERDGEAIVVIDTAGIRRERSVQNSVDFYAQRRSERAVRRADVTALVLDAAKDVGRVDREIAAVAADEAKPVVVVANKWDLAPAGTKRAAFTRYVRETLPHLAFAPVVFASATRGSGVWQVVETARALHRAAATRTPTSDVNRVLERATAMRRPPPVDGKVGRVYYGTQVEATPPTFVLFVDDPRRFPQDYERFLANRFREMLPAIRHVPVRIRFRARLRSPSKAARGPKPPEE